MTPQIDAVWPLGLDDREVRVLALRVTHTLNDIGEVLEVSRERVRQIESGAEARLLGAAQRMIPVVIESIRQIFDTFIAVNDLDLTLVAPTADERRREILLRAMRIARARIWGDQLDGWWTKNGRLLAEKFAELAESAPFADEEVVQRALMIGLPKHMEIRQILERPQSPLRLHPGGPWWVRRSAANRDAAFLWLGAQGEARSTADVGSALGVAEHPIREAMRRDDRFVQLRPSGLWALAEWNLATHDYRTALDAVIAILSARGPLTFKALCDEMSQTYPVTSWRVQQCLSSSAIGQTPDGRVGLIADGATLIDDPEPPRPPNVAVAADGSLFGVRIPVDFDLLRGSGLPFPAFVAWHLGLRHAPSAAIFEDESGADITIARQLGMVQISSLRRFALDLNLIDGCSLVVLLNTRQMTAKCLHGCRPGICPRDHAGETS